MKINEFHNSIRQLLNIGQAQYFPPETIDLQLNNAVNETFRQEYKHFESTQEISDTLGFYKKLTAPLPLDENKQVDIPPDFHHLTGVEAILEDDTRAGCEVIADSYWLNRKHSLSFAPSENYPIARQIGSRKIEILPSKVKSVVIFYLRKPAVAKYAFIPDASGTGWAFDSANSIDVDWPEIGHAMIQDKAITYLGLSLRDKDLIRNESVRKSQNEEA